MRELLIATGNKSKLPGLRIGLAGLPFEILTLNDIDKHGEVEESAETIEGNAIIKAMTYAIRSQKLTLADDSGLEVDALDGRPGVRSARYVPGIDSDRYQKVLDEMKDVPDEKRTARFVSVIAICDPQKDYKVSTSRGTCEGRIIHEPKGTHGFGYDPIFYANVLKKTFAESPIEELAPVSHRGNAMAKAREALLKEFV